MHRKRMFFFFYQDTESDGLFTLDVTLHIETLCSCWRKDDCILGVGCRERASITDAFLNLAHSTLRRLNSILVILPHSCFHA